MRRPAHADETRNRARPVALAVTRGPKNTPSDTLTAPRTMRLLPIVLWAGLGFVPCATYAACNEAGGCADSVQAVATGPATAADSPLQLAEMQGGVTPVLGSHDVATGPGHVASVSDARPTSALVMRSDGARTGARAAKGERSRAEAAPAGSESSSVWLMLFAGLAFAGFVIAKRTRG
jgi:hypothetical protein